MPFKGKAKKKKKIKPAKAKLYIQRNILHAFLPFVMRMCYRMLTKLFYVTFGQEFFQFSMYLH